MEHTTRTDGDAVDDTLEGYFDGIEVTEGTTGHGDVMQITLAILCFGIVLLEFLWCPWQFYQGYTVALRDVREFVSRTNITTGIGRCEDCIHVWNVRIILLSGVVVAVCPFEIGFTQV